MRKVYASQENTQHRNAHFQGLTPFAYFGKVSRSGGGGGFRPLASMIAEIASMVATSGLKFPGRKPCARSSGVQPLSFLRFQSYCVYHSSNSAVYKPVATVVLTISYNGGGV
jgi:hypothetical protein